MERSEIEHVFTAEQVYGYNEMNRMKNLVQNGHSLKCSGDIVFIQKQGYISNQRFGYSCLWNEIRHPRALFVLWQGN
ncbi:MAG: hypothetical protein CMC18_02925 [Flavobacteriaceae bacterium]|nr:hypothetical protein [Flavobacteriaceae bacterium]